MTTLPTLPTLPPIDGPQPADPAVLALVDDRYALLSYVGHGGMGVVFRARDRLKGDIVALKRMTEPMTLPDVAERRTATSAIGTAGWEAGSLAPARARARVPHARRPAPPQHHQRARLRLRDQRRALLHDGADRAPADPPRGRGRPAGAAAGRPARADPPGALLPASPRRDPPGPQALQRAGRRPRAGARLRDRRPPRGRARARPARSATWRRRCSGASLPPRRPISTPWA